MPLTFGVRYFPSLFFFHLSPSKWKRKEFLIMNGVWITSSHNIFGLFYSSVLFLSSFVRDNEKQLQLVTDFWYLRNSRCLCFTTHHFLLPLWFIRWLNPILQCVRFYFSSLMSHLYPPYSRRWSNSFHRYWLNIVYVPSTVFSAGDTMLCKFDKFPVLMGLML